MKKKTSIKSQLTWLLIYCWIVPVLAISAVCVMYIQTAVKDRAEGNIRSGASYAAQMSSQKLESAIQQMRDVIYEGAVAKHYKEQQDQNALTAAVRGELLRKFGLQKEYLFAGIFFSADPGRMIYESPYGGAYLDAYLKDAHAQVVSALGEEDNTTHLLVSGRSLYLYQNLLDNRDLSRYGVIVIQLDPAAVFDAFTSLDPAADYVLLSLDGQPYWLGSEPTEGPLRQFEFPTARQEMKVGALRGYITGTAVQKEQNYDFGYRVYVSDRIVSERAYMVLVLALVLACVVLPLLGVGFYRIYKNIAGPIDALVVATEKIENEQWDATIPFTSDNEFGRLIRSFNSMSARIKYLFDYAYKEELAASESRLMMLQSQMNPQFMKNTLGLINWKARLAGNEEISKMIEALDNLLDASLDRSQQRSIPLRQELCYTRSYLFIIGERFGRRLTLEEHIDESLLSCPVPRLIIQPLIENAVVHGIEPVSAGTIEICIGKMEGKLAIEIINDGNILSDEDLRRIRAILSEDYGALTDKQRRLGLKNVYERIRLMYGDAGSLTLQRTADGRTCTRIQIPFAPPEAQPPAKDGRLPGAREGEANDR